MGYAGYMPAKLPPPKPTEVQAALWSIPAQESLEVIGKLLRNIAISPSEERYKRVKLSNAKINQTIVAVPGAIDALLAMGWVRDEADQDCLVVPRGRTITMAEVRQVEDAKERLKKNARAAARSQAAAKVARGSDSAPLTCAAVC